MAPVDSESLPPDWRGPQARLLGRELAEGARTPRFRMAAVRQAIMLAGVFVLGWPAQETAVFFLLEVFLFLSFRAAAEISLDERYGVAARRPLAVAFRICLHLLVAVPFMGCIVGFFGAFAMIPFGHLPWASLRQAVRDPYFLGAVTLLAGSIVYDTALFARRVVAGRGQHELAQDAKGIKLALARLLVLVIATFTLGLAARAGLGSRAIALAVAGAVLFLEAAPQRAGRIFEPDVG